MSVLNDIGCDFEVASEGEFDKLINIGVDSNKIICSLPVKKISTIEYLYKKGCRYFVFDDKRELEKLAELAPQSKKILRIYVADVTPENIEFGMTYSEFQSVSESSDLINKIDGLTFYILNNVDIDRLEKVLSRCEKFFEKLKANNKILNIGGNYDLGRNLTPNFYERLQKRINNMIEKYGITVIAEPGRSIVKTAVKLFTEVVLIKDRGEYKQIFIDASSQIVKLKPSNVTLVNRKNFSDKKHMYKFYENLCSHYKLFEMELDFEISEGDVLSLEDYGCYSICFSNGFHGAYPPEQITI